ncbi:MAG: hypothetical protein ACRELG_07270 [Gemmataceae bacterium]
MANTFQNRPLSEEMAIVLTPLAVLMATNIAWLIWRQTNSLRNYLRMATADRSMQEWIMGQINSARNYLMFACFVGIVLLSVLLGVGFRYYKAHPFVGLLTALSLCYLLPASQAANSNDALQFVSGMVSGLGGGALTILFLVLVLKDMRGGSESSASTEPSSGPDTPDARWLGESGVSEGSHQVKGID